MPHCCNAINQIAVSKCSDTVKSFAERGVWFASSVLLTCFFMFLFFPQMKKCWMRRNLIRSFSGISSSYQRWLRPLTVHLTNWRPSFRNQLCLTLLVSVPPQVTRVDGDKILPYRSELVQILQLTLHLKCKQGYTLACNLLHHILRSSALIYPTEYCSVPGGFHQPITDYLPIKVHIVIACICAQLHKFIRDT